MERSPFRGVKLFFLAYFALLVLALTFIGVMGWLGFELIHMSVKFLLFGLLAASLMIAGAWALLRRTYKTWLKYAIGLPLGLCILVVMLIMYMAFTMILYAQTPIYYTTLTSPAGEPAVVMYSLNAEEALLAASNGTPDTLHRHFAVYPSRMRFFYYKGSAAEGEIIMVADSEARLMHEWVDENTLHMYVENPGEGEGGELTLKLK